MNENKQTLDKLFLDDVVFSSIKDEMKKAMNQLIESHQIEGLQINTRVAHDFLWYLIKDRKIEINKYIDSLIMYLAIIAAMNDRDYVTQSDLILLTEINMDELGFNNWEKTIESGIKDTMFRRYTIQLDINTDLKEQMGFRLDDNKLTNQDYIDAQKQIGWLNKSIEQVEQNETQAEQSEQLKNVFFQEKIIKLFEQMVNDLLARMRFMKLNFTTIVNSKNK